MMNGERKVVCVCRLVLYAFVGQCPNGCEACHKNGINTDDRIANLRWDTPVNNNADKLATGTLVWGEKHYNARLTAAQVVELRTNFKPGQTYDEYAVKYNVNRATIYDAVLGRTWKHLPI